MRGDVIVVIVALGVYLEAEMASPAAAHCHIESGQSLSLSLVAV